MAHTLNVHTRKKTEVCQNITSLLLEVLARLRGKGEVMEVDTLTYMCLRIICVTKREIKEW